MKTEPESATAVRVTDDGAAMVAEQVAPQEMPAGDEVTVPVPLPVLLMVRFLLTHPILELVKSTSPLTGYSGISYARA